MQKRSMSRQMTSVPRGVGLDSAAQRYAQLLADPCNGPLVSGPFGDGAGGIISRFEWDGVLGTGATDLGLVFGFIPAVVTSVFNAAPITSDTANVGGGLGLSPGQAYLTANAQAARCLSACIQVYYPGAELSRSGVVGIGQVDARVFNYATEFLQPAAVRTAVQNVERMPETYVEAIWRPNSFDLTYGTPGDFSSISKQSALAVSVFGTPVSVGTRIRMVAVYEWLPKNTNGLTNPIKSGNPSRNTLTDVLQYLDKFGNWMYRSAGSAASAASSIYRGASAVGRMAYGVSKYAALMAG